VKSGLDSATVRAGAKAAEGTGCDPQSVTFILEGQIRLSGSGELTKAAMKNAFASALANRSSRDGPDTLPAWFTPVALRKHIDFARQFHETAWRSRASALQRRIDGIQVGVAMQCANDPTFVGGKDVLKQRRREIGQPLVERFRRFNRYPGSRARLDGHP
jgi:hypothetical protein